MFLYLGAKWKIVNTDINFEYGTPTYAYLPLQKRKRKKKKNIYIYIYTHPVSLLLYHATTIWHLKKRAIVWKVKDQIIEENFCIFPCR